MSINLITDGWLYPVHTTQPICPPNTPDGTEGVVDPIPTTPCAGTGTPTDAPPGTPVGMRAAGPTTPTTPCGTTGSDPTLTPPEVPTGQEGSETVGNEAPTIPTCPTGEET